MSSLLGEGIPWICIPIIGTTGEEIIAQAEKIAKTEAELVEWRLDYFQSLSDIEALVQLLDHLKEIFFRQQLIVTIRSKAQGGEADLEEAKLARILEIAAGHTAVSYVDIEWFTLQKPERLLRRIQQRGGKVIGSHHDFSGTPDSEILGLFLKEMCRSDLDIVKLACMPKCRSDVLRLMEITEEFSERYPEKPLVTMSMGELGKISRISGQYFGSRITFGCLDQASAPGQIPYELLDSIIRGIQIK